MTDFLEQNTIRCRRISFQPGSAIKDCFHKAALFANIVDQHVIFCFNDGFFYREILVTPESDPERMFKEWQIVYRSINNKEETNEPA